MGDGTEGLVGLFKTTLTKFYRGQVIPLVSGWFGEFEVNFEEVSVVLAKEAAARDLDTIFPLVNSEKKRGAFLMPLQ